MEQFEEAICAIKRAQDYIEQLETVSSMLADDAGNVQKELVKELLKAMSRVVSSPDRPPLTKFYTIMIAKEFTSKKLGVFISQLASSQLLQDMLKLAKEVDPQKKMSDKGSSLFPGNKEIGNRYITLVLECLIVWSEKFPRTSTKQETKYALALKQLESKRVVLPKEFMYFEHGSKSEYRKEAEQTKETPQPKDPPVSAESHLKHSLAKMQGFYSFLAQCKDEDELFRECNKYHKSFQDDMKKLQTNSNQYMEALSQESINIYVEIIDFYHHENELYKSEVEEHKDIRAYAEVAQSYLEGFQRHFSGKQIKKTEQAKQQPPKALPPKPVSGNQVTQQRRDSKPPQRPELPDASMIIRKVDSESTEIRRKIQERQQDQEPPRQPTGSRVDRRESGSRLQAPPINLHQLEHQAEQGQQHIMKLLSASAVGGSGGFNSIKQDLLKEKGAGSHYHSKFARNRSKTPLENYRSRSKNEENFNNSMSQSKVSVFDMFPDVVVSRTQYSGKVVPMQLDYSRQLIDLTDPQQGARRFKISNFKAKSLLLQHKDLQIGFKSTAHYGEPEHFKQCLRITMFFGNKAEDPVTHFSLQFEGDRTCLVYAHPQKIDPTIQPGFQAKQELLVVPIELPFGLVNMKIKYTLRREVCRHSIVLPVTMWKFVELRQMEASDFQRNFTPIKNNAMRTIPFRLSRSLPPSALQRYLSDLTQLTDYQQFLQQKSYTEYKLCALVTAMHNHEYLLKLRVRPDMSVVIQLAALSSETAATQLGSFLLQTLQFLLERLPTEK